MSLFEGKARKLLSIVVPVYNEQLNIEKFYTEATKAVQNLDMEYEIIFVDDGSRDATPLLLSRLTQQDEHVRALLLARNFGHQLAITCGMDHARGDAIVTMDGDLQHPPEMIPQLVQYWREGYDVVQTMHIAPGGSDFRLIDKRVLATFKLFREHDRFIRGMIGDIGYKQKTVDFVAPPRFAGKSKFSVRKMLHFALDGIMAYSKIPLRISFYAGLVSAFLSVLIILHALYSSAVGSAAPGWTTVIVVICILGALQLMFIGIVGEYIGRIFEEVKQRPLYWLRAELGGRGEPEERNR